MITALESKLKSLNPKNGPDVNLSAPFLKS